MENNSFTVRTWTTAPHWEYGQGSQVDEHGSCDLAHADVHLRALEAEERRQQRDEDPGVKPIEEHLEHGISRYQPSGQIVVALGQVVSHQHHRDAAGEAHKDQSDRIPRQVLQQQHS